MALPTGSGSEILKNIMWNSVTSSAHPNLTGVALHIYTIISIIAHRSGGNTTNLTCRIYGYDSYGSANNENIILFNQAITGEGTFVWNDKFSFHGQGANSGVQKLEFVNSSSNTLDIVVTYIDQDWS